MTIEYSIDDFAVAQFAQSLGNTSVAKQMDSSAQNWEYLYDPGAGTLQGRESDEAFSNWAGIPNSIARTRW